MTLVVNYITNTGRYDGVELPIIEGNVDITVPTKVSELDNDSGYITSAAIEGKANTADLSQVAFSGDYNDLENKPEIPSLEGYATETYVGNAVSTHNSSNDAHSDIRGSIATINSKIFIFLKSIERVIYRLERNYLITTKNNYSPNLIFVESLYINILFFCVVLILIH